MHASRAMLTPPKTNMTSWKIPNFSIRDTSDSLMVAFAIMFVFGGANILQMKKKTSCKHDSDHDPIFSPPPPQSTTGCLHKKTRCLSWEPNLHISGFVSMKREQPATTPPRGQGKTPSVGGGNRSYSAMRGLPTDNIYIYTYIWWPPKKTLYICFVQN